VPAVTSIAALYNEGGALMLYVTADSDGNIYNKSSISTGLTFTPDEWMRLELDYAIGATSFAIAVDATWASRLALYFEKGETHAY